MTDRKGFISDEEYKKIVTQLPLPCVDVVVVYEGKFILGKRRIEPAGGEWWPPGGRVLIGELLKDAVNRKLKDDLGIDICDVNPKFLFTGETIFPNSGGGYKRHTVNAVYRVDLEENPNVDFEKSGVSDFSEIRWFDKVDNDWSEYTKLCLEKAGFK